MKRRLILAPATFLALLIVAAGLGCAHAPGDPHYEGPKERGEELLAYYQYPKAEIESRKEQIKEKKPYSVYRIEFANVYEINQEAEPIRLDYYQSRRSGKLPTILITPGYRGDTLIVRSIARYFASHGINAGVVHQGKKLITETEDGDGVEVYLKYTIVKNRQVVDWLIQQEEVDQERLGSLGISLGAIKNVLTAGVDPRLKCHVFALAGGNLADIVCYSKLREIRKWRERIMRKKGITLAQLHHDLCRNVTSDPITLGAYIDAKNVLMFIASYDRVISKEYAETLRRAIGNPEVIYLPFGHCTSALFLPYARAQSLAFFRKCFGRH